MCASHCGDGARALAWQALLVAACGLAGCDGRSPANAAGARDDDPASARPAHAPPFDTPATGPASAAGTVDEVVQLEQQVAQLRSDVAALRAEVASGTTAPPGARRAPPALADAQQLAAAEAAFRGEAIDADWSRAMADSVQAAVGQVDPGHAPPRQVECRSQSCRIEFAAEGGPRTGADLAPVLERFAQTLPRAIAGQGEAADGRKATVVYLSR
jgi:hypothetical protein